MAANQQSTTLVPKTRDLYDFKLHDWIPSANRAQKGVTLCCWEMLHFASPSPSEHRAWEAHKDPRCPGVQRRRRGRLRSSLSQVVRTQVDDLPSL